MKTPGRPAVAGRGIKTYKDDETQLSG